MTPQGWCNVLLLLASLFFSLIVANPGQHRGISKDDIDNIEDRNGGKSITGLQKTSLASGQASGIHGEDKASESLYRATTTSKENTRSSSHEKSPGPALEVKMIPVAGLRKPSATAPPIMVMDMQPVRIMPSTIGTDDDDDDDGSDDGEPSGAQPSQRVSSSALATSASRKFKSKFNTPDRSKWQDYSISTDYTKFTPHTGVTRHYELIADEATLSPDGVPSPFMQVFNGQFPGPLIEANWGDEIEIYVKNKLRDNGTSIHWHGFPQTNRSQNDGVNGVTQCPIPPGSGMHYKIRAERYGVSWYHSHTSLQYGNGLLGPIVIHGPSSADWDYDLGTLVVGDWYNRSQFILLNEFFASGPPAAASTVFNGHGVRNTNGNLTGHYYDITRKMKFKPGARYLLRIINAAVDAKYELSLDGHKMEVISLDWTPIKPYKTRTAFLANGQRMQVVIRAKGSPGKSYWFRADTTALAMDRGTTCGDRNLSANQSRAIIRYIGADHSEPTSRPHLYTPHCSDESLKGASPVVPLRLRAPKSTQNITINPLQANASGDLVFRVDNSSLYLNFNKPTLNLINDGFSRFPPSYNVYFLEGHSKDTALIVLQDQTGIPHPVHLHGHDISIASLGAGPWNGTLKFNNPARRDTVQMESNGHLAMHFAMDNPGAWLWHCHIAFHVSAGFGAQFVERLKDINIESNVTQTYKTCSQWDAWTKYNLVLQFDSGV